MTILVAGSTGQVATCLRARAAQNGLAALTCIGRPQLDLARPHDVVDAVRKLSPKIIVNAAAYTDVERAEDEPEAAFLINAKGTEALAIAAQSLGVPFIHLSTDYVFSGEKSSPYVEDDVVGPINTYGASKLEGERLVQQACENAVILRTSWVYSPFGKNFMLTINRLLQARDEISVVADQVGAPTSAWDIADAILSVVDAKLQGHASTGIFHLAGNGYTSWHGFACTIRDHVGRAVAVNPIDSASYPTKAKRPKNSQLDTSKLYAHFGISLPTWQQSLATCMRQLT